MRLETKLSLSSLLMTACSAAFAQPSTSPGGGFTWMIAGAAFAAGVAVGYYIGKSSGSSDDKDK